MRDTDPVEIPSAAGLLLLALPQDPRLPGIARPDTQDLAGRLRQSRRALQDPIVAAQLRRLAARACVQIPTGLPNADALIDAVSVGLTQKTIIGMFLPRVPMGIAVAVTAPKPGPTPAAAFAGMSPEQRIGLLLERTPKELAPDLARAFRSMVTVEALAGIAAAFAVLLAAQFFGVGEIADAALAWWAYAQAGFSGVYGLYQALSAVVAAVRAPDEAGFDKAVKGFAEGLTLVGVALLSAVVTRAARRRAAPGEGNAASEAAPPAAGSAPDPIRPRRTIPPAAAKAAKPPTYVLGRRWDTAVAEEWPEHSILNIPDWTIAKNDAFIQNIIDQRGTVYLASPQSAENLWDAVADRPTVFGRELDQLKSAGYKQAGDYMYPPPNY